MFAPPHLSPLSTMETNLFEVSSFFALASSSRGGQVVPEFPPDGIGPVGILESGFYTPELD